jgi:hypothetical protein
VLGRELGSELAPELTGAYVRARYAEQPVPEGEVQRLRARWEAAVAVEGSPRSAQDPPSA